MHVTCIVPTCKTSQIPACYMHVSGIMHGIVNSSVLSLEISCMKITGCSRMKYAETHVSGAPFRVGGFSYDYLNLLDTFCTDTSKQERESGR